MIEVAVVIAILAFVLGAIAVPLSVQLKLKDIREAERELDDVKEALMGYALTNGRLPCPDTDRDGIENATAACTATPGAVVGGTLPWLDVGVGPSDPWGRYWLYYIDTDFTDQVALSLDSSSSLTVQDRPSMGAALNLTTTAAVVVISTGLNGHGGINLDNVTQAGPVNAGSDEALNRDATLATPTGVTTFFQRPHTPGADTCNDVAGPFCEYDDLVLWLSGNVFKARMVAAGKL